MVECHPPVVLVVIAELRAQVASLDARHVLVRVSISNLEDERRNTVVIDLAVFVRDSEPSQDQSVIGVMRKLTGPPLGRVN